MRITKGQSHYNYNNSAKTVYIRGNTSLVMIHCDTVSKPSLSATNKKEFGGYGPLTSQPYLWSFYPSDYRINFSLTKGSPHCCSKVHETLLLLILFIVNVRSENIFICSVISVYIYQGFFLRREDGSFDF